MVFFLRSFGTRTGARTGYDWLVEAIERGRYQARDVQWKFSEMGFGGFGWGNGWWNWSFELELGVYVSFGGILGRFGGFSVGLLRYTDCEIGRYRLGSGGCGVKNRDYRGG